MATKERKEWYYIDKEEVEQGPFTFTEMQAWWHAGYLFVILYILLIFVIYVIIHENSF